MNHNRSLQLKVIGIRNLPCTPKLYQLKPKWKNIYIDKVLTVIIRQPARSRHGKYKYQAENTISCPSIGSTIQMQKCCYAMSMWISRRTHRAGITIFSRSGYQIAPLKTLDTTTQKPEAWKHIPWTSIEKTTLARPSLLYSILINFLSFS